MSEYQIDLNSLSLLEILEIQEKIEKGDLSLDLANQRKLTTVLQDRSNRVFNLEMTFERSSNERP